MDGEYLARRNHYIDLHYANLESIRELRRKLQVAIDSDDKKLISLYSRRLNNKIDNNIHFKSQADFVRPIIKEDYECRYDLLTGDYRFTINDIIPDDVPLVFHGSRHLGVVLEILKSGGLFTPEQRNIDYISFATQIDVTYKSNIRTSLEFAEPGLASCLPYGAIFVFYPEEDEYNMVLKTGESSEVFGGVNGVNFLEHPERLFAVITTDENINRLKRCALEVGHDADKIVNHDDFIKLCRNKFNIKNKRF